MKPDKVFLLMLPLIALGACSTIVPAKCPVYPTSPPELNQPPRGASLIAPEVRARLEAELQAARTKVQQKTP